MTTLSVIRGDDYRLTGTWNDPDGDPINLTGWDLAMRVKIPGMESFEYGIGTGITVTAPVTGVFSVHISKVDTATWSASGDYYVIATSPGTEDSTIMLGRFEVIPRVRS